MTVLIRGLAIECECGERATASTPEGAMALASGHLAREHKRDL